MLDYNLKCEHPMLYEAALREFSSLSYERASLNNILKAAKMSKGSFYHHIGDKYSLYLMLINCIKVKKLEIIQEMNISNIPENFFERMKILVRSNSEFVLKEPLISKLYNQYIKESPEFKAKLIKSFEFDANEYWDALIEDGFIRGHFRNDIPREVVKVFIKAAVKESANLLKPNMTSKEINDAFSGFLDILQDAIASRHIEEEK